MTEIQENMMNELLSASYVSSFDISRTGDSIVYARNSRDGRSLHLLLRNTSATYDDHTVAAEDGTYESLMLTGDGRKLIYLRDNNGDEKFDIFTCRIEEHCGSFRLTDKINLTPDTDFSILRGISQDETGRRIAFVSNRDGNFASYFLDTTDRKTKRISRHGYSDDGAPRRKWKTCNCIRTDIKRPIAGTVEDMVACPVSMLD